MRPGMKQQITAGRRRLASSPAIAVREEKPAVTRYAVTFFSRDRDTQVWITDSSEPPAALADLHGGVVVVMRIQDSRGSKNHLHGDASVAS